ncbi:MAG: DUF4388 domain-containing protein [Myxococcaceae bacterium]|nr:DUF4388 domain-containing protein [Myxococcaceae bacterium]
MDQRFVVDPKGGLAAADGQGSPLSGRTGYFRLQPTSPDWLLFVRSPSQGGVIDKKPRVVLAGDCGTFALQDLIAFLGQARWTGVLRLSAPGTERLLTIKDGEVRSAASDSPADRIGEVMVRMGYVTRAQLEQVLSDAPPSRVGKAMVERGFLKSHDLYKCLQEQITEIFHGMMLQKEGTFLLIDQELDEKTLAHSLSLSMQGLLMDSIRKIDELAQFRKRIPHGKLYVVRKKASDGKLEPEEDQLLAAVDGVRTVIELGQLTKVSEFDATRIVYRLIEGGYVQVSQTSAAVVATPAASAPRPPAPAPSAPAPAPAPAPLEPPPDPLAAVPWPPPAIDERKVLHVFNFIFREVRDEVARRGQLDMFLASANAALRGSGVSTSRVLNGLSFLPDGSLDEAQVLAQYGQLKHDGQMGSEPLMSFKQALSDVMFFLLFQAGELLESRADEELARRVKELLSTIDMK